MTITKAYLRPLRIQRMLNVTVRIKVQDQSPVKIKMSKIFKIKCFKMLNIKPGTLFDGIILLWFSRFLSIVTTWPFPLAKSFFSTVEMA